jgi:hypothetical protein
MVFDTSALHAQHECLPNLLVTIKETKGNVFQGFIPLGWESRAKIGSGITSYQIINEVSKLGNLLEM